MIVSEQSVKDQKLARVQDVARRYFEARDTLDAAKLELLEAIFDATEDGSASQHEIARTCDLSDSDPSHKFHRTRIQQLLSESRRAKYPWVRT